MQLHKQTLEAYRQQVIIVSDKWQSKIREMSSEDLHSNEFLERVKKSAAYFSQTLTALFEKPFLLTKEVNVGNKQAMSRLGNALPDLRQATLARRYLLVKISEQGYSISNYLKEKQMSMLDAIDEQQQKSKRERKPKAQKEPKEKTYATSLRLFLQGMSPLEIAKERSLTVGTIMGHLARYLETGEVLLDSLITPEHQSAIMKVIHMVGTAENTTAIKALCPAEVSFDEIRLMLSVAGKSKEP